MRFRVVGFKYGADDNVTELRESVSFNDFNDAMSFCEKMAKKNDGFEYRVITNS